MQQVFDEVVRVGNCSHTWGRKVPRWPCQDRIRPSTPGFRPASSSSLEVAGIGSVAESSDTSIRIEGSSCTGNGGNRGSPKAAEQALRITSSPSRRCGCTDPMQPRSRDSWVKVTKVAPGSWSHPGPSGGRACGPRAAMDVRARPSSTGPAAGSSSGRTGAGRASTRESRSVIMVTS